MTVRRVDKGRTHWYEDTETGERIHSVTEIQRKAIPKQDILVPWAGRKSGDYVLDNWPELEAMKPSERYKVVANAHKRSNEAAKAKGTAVHVLGAAVASGAEVVVPGELAGYVEAYTQFLYDYDVTVFMSEAIVWSKQHGHVGTLDMGALLDIPHEAVAQRWLIDVKTGNSVYDDTGFQLSGYRYADTWVEVHEDGTTVELDMPEFDRCGVLHVREDGYDLRPVEVSETTYRGFLYLKESMLAIEANKGCIGEPLNPPIRALFDPPTWTEF